MTHANGSKYDGQFEMGRYHGRGFFSDADGSMYEGQWKYGLLIDYKVNFLTGGAKV